MVFVTQLITHVCGDGVINKLTVLSITSNIKQCGYGQYRRGSMIVNNSLIRLYLCCVTGLMGSVSTFYLLEFPAKECLGGSSSHAILLFARSRLHPKASSCVCTRFSKLLQPTVIIAS